MALGGSMSYQFDDVHHHGGTLVTQAGTLHAEHQAIIRTITEAADFWGGAGSTACQAFIAELGRNFEVIYTNLEDHGGKVQVAGNNMQHTDHSVGGSWMV